MIKKEMSIKRCLIAASMAGTMVFSSIPAVPVFAEGENTSSKIHVEVWGDRISVDGGYDFWTTKTPKKNKIPSADKWTYETRSVDTSTSKKATKYYFSQTPNPKDLNEILVVEVPAKDAAPKYKYDQSKEVSFDEKKSDNDNAITMIANAAKATTEYSELANGEFWTIEESFDDALQYAQENGGTFYFREAGVSTSGNATKSSNADEFTTVTLTGYTRPSVAKAVKIAKRANGPAATVNYASHTVKIKKGGSFVIIKDGDYSDVAELPTASWDATSAKDKAYEAPADPDAIIAVRTAASNKKVASKITYVHVDASAEASFADSSSKVAIVGEYNSAATLQIESKEGKEAYQYAFTDSTKNIGTVFDEKTGDFNYTGAAALKWKSLKTKDTKVGTAKLAWKSANGQYVLVRKAAVGSTFSSNVVVFKAPTKAGEGWKYVTEEDYDKDLSKASMAPTLSFKYDASKNAFKVIATGSGDATVVSGKTATGKISKNKKMDADTTNNAFKADKLIDEKDIPASGTVTLTVPAGAIKFTMADKLEVLNQAATYTVSFTNTDKWDATTNTTSDSTVTKVKPQVTSILVKDGTTKVEEATFEKNGGTGTFVITFDQSLDAETNGEVKFESTKSNVADDLQISISNVKISGDKTVEFTITNIKNTSNVNNKTLQQIVENNSSAADGETDVVNIVITGYKKSGTDGDVMDKKEYKVAEYTVS